MTAPRPALTPQARSLLGMLARGVQLGALDAANGRHPLTRTDGRAVSSASPRAVRALQRAGLIVPTPTGWALTDDGRRRGAPLA